MYDSDNVYIDARVADVLSAETRAYLWAQWDKYIGDRRIKLKWGPFRPSFRIGAIFEPIVVKWIGPRPHV